ncbi:MAG: DUF1800 domain-containing protein [Steroidobacteraceae bacterium]
MPVITGCGGGGGSSPPPPLVSKAEASRFLEQGTFGATDAAAGRLIELGDSTIAYSRWIDEQLAAPVSFEYPYVLAAYQAKSAVAGFAPGQVQADRVDIWFQNAVNAPDQLRQRVAWALSQIMVVSQVSLNSYPLALADYYDTLARDAFGDFRTLLQDVTLHPAMGLYLNMLGNQKPNDALNIRPDENYARELMQLMSIGLVQLNTDGTVKQDEQGVPLPTYDQAVVEGFAHTYTGWKWACAAGSPATCTFASTRATLANQSLPMQSFPEQHATGPKRLLAYSGAAQTGIPAGQTSAQDLKAALDNVADHPNVGPFISRQLIQKLVASNPSPAYVQRVAAKFNDDGTGRRGTLAAVVRAILLDPEARNAATGAAVATAGKAKEPLLRLTQLWRAFDGKAATGRYLNINPSGNLGQGPLQAASVFNFFSPFYAPAGEMADRGLVAPELQLSTEYQNTLVANYFFGQIFNRNSRSGVTNPDGVVIDIDAETALAGDAPALVTRIADKLLGGRISATLRAAAEANVGRVAASIPAQRVAEALWLIASSPEYAMQR